MNIVEILINNLRASYSSNCHFKIKVVSSSTQNKESAENKHSFKYDKTSSEVNINEKLELQINDNLSFDHKFHFYLEVYTKSGYKTAGVGILQLSKDIKLNTPILIEILKCPLGKGTLEIQFIKLDLIKQEQEQEKEQESTPEIKNNNYGYSNNYSNNNTSYTNATNYMTQSNINNNANGDYIREKEEQIKELKTKIDYYEEENNELKNLINDFKRDKKKLLEEKNSLINQYNEQIQKLKTDKEDIEMQYMNLQQNMNLLENNKNNIDQKIIDIKNNSDKQIKELSQQVKNLSNIKFQLENDNKIKEEKILNLEKQNQEITMNYKKQMNQMDTNFSSEKNKEINNYKEQLKQKDEEIGKLNIQIKSLEENNQSLNEIVEITKKEKRENDGNNVTENMSKLLEQISEKDKKIFNLQKEINELNNKINKDLDNKDTQNMLSTINEKELKKHINELQEIINEKDNELNDLRTKYDTLKYESSKFKTKVDYNDEEQFSENNNEIFINQLKEVQKTYKEREEKLLNEKNEEIRKLKMRNKDLFRESVLDNNNNVDISKYVNEINRLKNLNSTLEEDLNYYKEINSRFVETEKKSTVYESENIQLKNLLQQKENEIDNMQKKEKEYDEKYKFLEKQLVDTKDNLGNLLNDLAEAESNCVKLEEEKKQLKNNKVKGISTGGILGKIKGITKKKK
jgi:chromosome segregation ATPase